MPVLCVAGAPAHVRGAGRCVSPSILVPSLSSSAVPTPTASTPIPISIHHTATVLGPAAVSSVDSLALPDYYATSGSAGSESIVSPASSLSSVDSTLEYASSIASSRSSASRAASIKSRPSSPTTAFLASSHARLSKPILTQRSSSDSIHSFSSIDSVSPRTLLKRIFASDDRVHSLVAEPVELAEHCSGWVGALVDDAENDRKTMFVLAGTDNVNLRETICELIDVAEQKCANGIVICLDKTLPDLGETLHSLMYVGGTVVSGVYKTKSQYLLVGLDV